jgi:hypothetical protein
MTAGKNPLSVRKLKMPHRKRLKNPNPSRIIPMRGYPNNTNKTPPKNSEVAYVR